MTPMAWFNSIAGAMLVFFIILLASAIMDRQRSNREYKKPNSDSGRGLKIGQVFPESKTMETVTAEETIQTFRRAGQ